jgi:hypothetical protein
MTKERDKRAHDLNRGLFYRALWFKSWVFFKFPSSGTQSPSPLLLARTKNLISWLSLQLESLFYLSVF